MKKSLKKIITVLLSLTVICSMSATAFAADSASAQTKTATTKATTEKAADIVSTLGMFSPAEGTTSVKIDKMTGMAKVTFTTLARSAKYTKLSLVKISKTSAVKESKAVKGTVTEVSTGKYTSTFTFDISVSKLGKKMPISLYQVYTKADGTKIDGWYNYGNNNQYYLTVKFTPSVVNDLTKAIYYQKRTAGTDSLCAAAKAGWDSLTDAQKKLVVGFGYYEDASEAKGGYDYFGADTGDASADDPANANSIGDYELLVASFGTSFNDSRVLTVGGVESALETSYPEYSVRRGFTSQIIINHIQARDGEFIDNIDQAMERAVKNRVKVLVVQSTTLMAGAEYDELVSEVNKYKSHFSQIVFSKPLCSTDADKTAVAKAIYADAAVDAGFKNTATAAADKDTAFVFMGHGTSHSAQVLYTQMQTVVSGLGYNNCFIGTVEGKPASTSCENIIAAVKKAGYKKVVLRPLMVVAGDHANNDMAGDDSDSWKSQFKAAGFNVSTQIKGLGQLEAIQDIYVAHTKDAIAKVVAKTSISKVKAGTRSAKVVVKKQSGAKGYQIRYATSKSMKNARTVSTTSTSKTIKKLNSGKKYYFQVRVYKTVDKTKAYSVWSKVKTVKVK
ncbi:sirohydrochlorin cobaltochelatase [Aminicella lysinilytica]|uniref:Cobalamin biosynthesis Co2+ chelatase CbiK n=1 Tax=Aminicella lysinilytica TaxID=433323 RepID=A0A4R6PYB7_9FIRM|nr:sirohydrochlorin cobaltochelatase [Aminicella lysinilytica]TDP51963.1 cobalamin biosynthesis Co2+ chelatase CbiK [Aminicella lysinilytica]